MTSLVVMACLLLAQAPASSAPGRPSSSPSGVDVVASVESAVADAIARAEPSVVAIHRWKKPNTNQTLAVRGRKPDLEFGERDPLELPNHLPLDVDFISFDFGSGVVVGDRGEILTAFHVVRGAGRLVVRAAGRQSFDAEVIAADPRIDLAVIAPVQQGDGDLPRLKPIAIGDASKLRKGSFLIVLGNSFNAAREDGSPSAGWGILSNIARRLEPESDGLERNPPRKALQEFSTLLQLDAKLNLGMSGGAVINLKGELVGLTTTASSPAGFDVQAGYAIPMDRMGRRAVEALKQGKEVEYGLLGITADAQGSNRVSRVLTHSPAALGMIQDKDEILAVNDRPIADFDSLIVAVSVYGPGESVRLKLRRSDEIIERTVVLAKAHVDGEIIATNRPHAWRGLRVDYASTVKRPGMDVLDMTMAPVGVIVTEVEEPSPAAAAGLKKGVLILRVGDRPIHDPRAFAQAVADQPGPVTLETDLGVLTVGAADSYGQKPKPRSRPIR